MAPFMSKRIVINSIGAVLVLLSLWLLLQYQTRPEKDNAVLEIRSISAVSLPPPPAPPPTTTPQPEQAHVVDLNLHNAPALVQLEVALVEMALPELSLPKMEENEPLVETLAFDSEALVASITTFGLEDLDTIPRLVTTISVSLPTALKQRGIRQAQLQLHVIINESGQVTLVNVAESQYPELHALAPRIVQQARFTPPLRQGKKVKAEFLWPLKVSG